MAVAAFREVGSVTAARRPILLAHNQNRAAGNKVFRFFYA
uniref:Uncharacterized protein n=1 Tax=Siphoviridae sp. ctWlk2 TaxID=2825539 RepID=A0A8S5U6N3_9CAUD|nr:MAG TPA: hypothetical protein [Siphoviridae sp. ctWlk2]